MEIYAAMLIPLWPGTTRLSTHDLSGADGRLDPRIKSGDSHGGRKSAATRRNP